jgi:rhomboid family GlyGly-CTERM serine protease
MVVVNAELFALTPAAGQGEVWRLWTGHLVHYGLAHAMTNALAIVLPLSFIDRRSRNAILTSLTIFAPVMSVVLLAGAHFDEYRGASGLALAVWIASAFVLLRAHTRRGRWIGIALLLLAIAKLGAEIAGWGHVWTGVAPLPLAHFAGACAGVVVCLIETVSRGDAAAAERTAPPPETVLRSNQATPLDPAINTAQY